MGQPTSKTSVEGIWTMIFWLTVIGLSLVFISGNLGRIADALDRMAPPAKKEASP